MSENNKIEASYNEVTYDTLPHVQGNLRNLETIGDIFQVKPVDIRSCRVLELGTATGKTLIPQAEEFSESEFLGIDLSEQQILAGQETIKTLGLKNISLRHENIMSVVESWGKFDYIIVHGVYSWVPPFVQDKILDICKTNLSDNGIAMVSYNTYPGWHFKEFARNLMLFHTRQANKYSSAETTVQQARSIINFAAKLSEGSNGYYANYLKNTKDACKTHEDYYIYHEYLEVENRPCYFSEFNNRLKERDLRHVSDVEWSNFCTWLMNPDVRGILQQVSDTEVAEQYVDFFINRTFRSSIFCRSSAAVNKAFRGDLSERYTFYLPLQTQVTEKENAWAIVNGKGVSCMLPKNSVEIHLAEYLKAATNKYFNFNDLKQFICDSQSVEKSDRETVLRDMKFSVNRLVGLGLLKPLLHRPDKSKFDGTFPKTSAFVRNMAQKKSSAFPNLHFESVRGDQLSTFVVQRLDGEHSILDIIREMQNEIRSGKMRITQNEENMVGHERIQIQRMIEKTVSALKDYRLCGYE